jgi:hypothetical protein
MVNATRAQWVPDLRKSGQQQISKGYPVYRSSGHHVEGGSFAEILVGRKATR